jgi:dihydroorotate dehydrogenase
MLYEALFKPLLFSLDPERAHDMVALSLETAQKIPGAKTLLSLTMGRAPKGLETEVFGLKFPNPVGLAAGFDKDCRMIPGLMALGFGFIEVGSITLNPQSGNPRPRMFRVPEHEGLINRMGFNSRGADAAARRLAGLCRHKVPLGINLGLNKDVPPEKAPAAYAETFLRLAPYGDYFVVNVSSPNTPGLRSLQRKLELEKILSAIQERNVRKSPVLIKLDPDGPEEALADVISVAERFAAGLVASNTTTSRQDLPGDYGEVRGGLSGAPLRSRATALIARLRKMTLLPIIGAGGIFTGADAHEKLQAGANLVQLYTGLVYRGPGAARKIQRELADIRRNLA